MVRRFEIYWVNLDPTVGCEINKVRPCVIISPDELNQNLSTVIIAPLTSTLRNYPSRIDLKFNGKKGQIVLDQIRTVDKSRLIEKAASIPSSSAKKIVDLLLEIFA
ncbi:MAG: type II toxin-antitoxin system PemK/MazF family toxin [Candidatus Melainabacteria bacterium]|nr:type II toxin-antitoxin system PemK/MazF family toxin [Candidatus Melainabacteria bacterium]